MLIDVDLMLIDADWCWLMPNFLVGAFRPAFPKVISFTQAGHFAALFFPAFAPYILAGHDFLPSITQVIGRDCNDLDNISKMTQCIGWTRKMLYFALSKKKDEVEIDQAKMSWC